MIKLTMTNEGAKDVEVVDREERVEHQLKPAWQGPIQEWVFCSGVTDCDECPPTLWRGRCADRMRAEGRTFPELVRWICSAQNGEPFELRRVSVEEFGPWDETPFWDHTGGWSQSAPIE